MRESKWLSSFVYCPSPNSLHRPAGGVIPATGAAAGLSMDGSNNNIEVIDIPGSLRGNRLSVHCDECI